MTYLYVAVSHLLALVPVYSFCLESVSTRFSVDTTDASAVLKININNVRYIDILKKEKKKIKNKILNDDIKEVLKVQSINNVRRKYLTS